MPTSTPTAPRRLRRPLPLDPEGFRDAVADLSLTDAGALVLLASAWWPSGVLPERPADCGKVLGIDSGRARAVVDRLRSRFAPDAYFGLLRAAHCAKAERRARAGRIGGAVFPRRGGVASLRH